jgi:hypothetical protein
LVLKPSHLSQFQNLEIFQVLELHGVVGCARPEQALAQTVENDRVAETKPKAADGREQTESWGLKLPHLS